MIELNEIQSVSIEMTLEELHKAYMQDKEKDEDYNYENDNSDTKDNEFTVLKNIFDIKRGGR